MDGFKDYQHVEYVDPKFFSREIKINLGDMVQT